MDGVPPIVLVVGFQDGVPDDSYVDVLEQGGFWVARSDSLGAAIRDIADLQPDAVITDVTATAGDPGVAAIVRTLKATSATAAVPLIVVEPVESAPTPVGDLGTLGARLAAPLSPLALRHAVERQIAASRAARRRAHADTPAVIAAAKPAGSGDAPLRRSDSEPAARPCPSCSRLLAWTERATVDGIAYDYFRWCESGCGLFCFDVASGQSLKLA